MNLEQSLAAARELHSLNPTALLSLYELDLTGIGEDSVLYFHNGTQGLRSPVVFQNTAYNPLPIEVKGFEVSGTSEPARPTLTVSNLGNFFSTLILATRDLVGAKLTRRRTWARFLDGMPDAGPIQLEPDVFFVDRKVKENRILAEFELGTPFDLDGVKFPTRRIISGYCAFDYRGSGCGFSGQYCVTNSKGEFFSGAEKFAGRWQVATEYQSPQSVIFSDGTYDCVYKCLSETPISGSANSPSGSPASWRKVQRYRGEFNVEVSDYQAGDVVFRQVGDLQVFSISIWSGTMPAGMTPPNSTFWSTDTCAKFLRHCEFRFDPLGTQKPLPFGGFPGTINLPSDVA